MYFNDDPIDPFARLGEEPFDYVIDAISEPKMRKLTPQEEIIVLTNRLNYLRAQMAQKEIEEDCEKPLTKE